MSRPAWIAVVVTFVVVTVIVAVVFSLIFDGISIGPALAVASGSAVAVYLAQKDRTPRTPR